VLLAGISTSIVTKKSTQMRILVILTLSLMASPAIASSSSPNPANHSVYCKVDDDKWHRVISFSENEVLVDHRILKFEEIWSSPHIDTPGRNVTSIKWEDLHIPLPEVSFQSYGYAMTYERHKKEVKLDHSFRFEKGGAPSRMSDPVVHRDNLDYEAEIGLLINRNTPDTFGYVMINDLTDRDIQVMTYDKDNPSPGFSKAKSFDGALKIGPLLLIGTAKEWDQLTMTLHLNSKIRQTVGAANCSKTPQDFFADTFDGTGESDWALISTGTEEGVIFQAPGWIRKMLLLLSSGFRMDKAKSKWLKSFRFLEVGDVVTVSSPLLGMAQSHIVERK
jgi:2-keto-4-pentenoate hydratase/2-oxohepta-3-ene-1,7-dioic acid hydratase in catechol pathway